MKKSIIAIGAGAFVAITILLCMNTDTKMYQKKKHFDTVNDVLIQLETNKLQEHNGDERDETDALQECLSKRKRLTYSQIGFQNIEIKEIEELDDAKKKEITDDYNKIQEELAMPYKSTNIQPVRLDIKGIFPYKDENGNTMAYDGVIDLVMVDEGEGMVIDYYLQNPDKNDKEGHLDAKG